MAQRGRKSSDAVAIRDGVSVVSRPDAPLDLTSEEGDVWQSVVNAMPADWFHAETFPLLAQYCRHTVTARRVSQLIDAACSRQDVDVAELRDLMAMQARETSALKAMAASMRLSQQASYHNQTAGASKSKRAPVKRPWDE